jgi:hypothetical protein
MVVIRFAEIVTVFLLFTLPVTSLLYVISLLMPGYIESAPGRIPAELSLAVMEMSGMGSPSESDNVPEFLNVFCGLLYRVTYLSTLLLLHPIL